MKQTAWKTERAWIEVNTDHLRHNVEILKKAMPPGCELMAVVKAEAYGHGAEEISVNLNRMGVTAFAAATVEEGIRLRQCGIQGEILILGYTDVRRAAELKEYGLIQTLIGYEYAKALDRQGITVRAHLKIDTGMHRLGMADEDVSGVKKVFAMENIQVCGMFTHLCCSDSRLAENVAYTRGQIARFYRLAGALKDSGITLPKLHIQSSYGLLNYPQLHCDYVRAGIALYGVLSTPHADTVLKLDLQPVLSLKSRIILIRTLEKGSSIGYGRSYTASRDSRIAILPVGYADGYPRNLSCGRGHVLVRGHRVPVAGRVCMDQLAIDITGVDAAAGDIVTLIGTDGERELPAPLIADAAGSISNELLSRMGARLPVVARN